MNEYDTLFCFPITTLGSERQVATRCVTSHQPSRHNLFGRRNSPFCVPFDDVRGAHARTHARMHPLADTQSADTHTLACVRACVCVCVSPVKVPADPGSALVNKPFNPRAD